jgi:hypothetical protein
VAATATSLDRDFCAASSGVQAGDRRKARLRGYEF